MSHLGSLFIISAPSGAGKTSLVNALAQSLKGIKISVSHTTRTKRVNEQNGINYNFVTREEFLSIQTKGVFLEYAEVFGNLYGTSKQWVEKTIEMGTDVLLEIDWQGAEQIRKLMPSVKTIFIIPPSRETLLSRLTVRDQDNPNIIKERMRGAKNEIEHLSDYDYLICNDRFEDALDELITIVRANRLKIQKQKIKYAELIKKLTP